MWIQAVGIAVIALVAASPASPSGPCCSGIGTAMVYPTLLAAIGDVAHPSWRASSVGVYRLWRDLGYAIGALLAGVTADALGLSAAVWLVAAITFASGLVVAQRMTETLAGPEAVGFKRQRFRASAIKRSRPGPADAVASNPAAATSAITSSRERR